MFPVDAFDSPQQRAVAMQIAAAAAAQPHHNQQQQDLAVRMNPFNQYAALTAQQHQGGGAGGPPPHHPSQPHPLLAPSPPMNQPPPPQMPPRPRPEGGQDQPPAGYATEQPNKKPGGEILALSHNDVIAPYTCLLRFGYRFLEQRRSRQDAQRSSTPLSRPRWRTAKTRRNKAGRRRKLVQCHGVGGTSAR